MTDKWRSAVQPPPSACMNCILRLVNDFLSTTGMKKQIKLSWAAANTLFSLTRLINLLLLAAITHRESFSFGRAINLPDLRDHTSSVTVTLPTPEVQINTSMCLCRSRNEHISNSNQKVPNQSPSPKPSPKSQLKSKKSTQDQQEPSDDQQVSGQDRKVPH